MLSWWRSSRTSVRRRLVGSDPRGVLNRSEPQESQAGRKPGAAHPLVLRDRMPEHGPETGLGFLAAEPEDPAISFRQQRVGTSGGRVERARRPSRVLARRSRLTKRARAARADPVVKSRFSWISTIPPDQTRGPGRRTWAPKIVRTKSCGCRPPVPRAALIWASASPAVGMRTRASSRSTLSKRADASGPRGPCIIWRAATGAPVRRSGTPSSPLSAKRVIDSTRSPRSSTTNMPFWTQSPSCWK